MFEQGGFDPAIDRVAECGTESVGDLVAEKHGLPRGRKRKLPMNGQGWSCL